MLSNSQPPKEKQKEVKFHFSGAEQSWGRQFLSPLGRHWLATTAEPTTAEHHPRKTAPEDLRPAHPSSFRHLFRGKQRNGRMEPLWQQQQEGHKLSFLSINKHSFYPNWKSNTSGSYRSAGRISLPSARPWNDLGMDLCSSQPGPVHRTNPMDCE